MKTVENILGRIFGFWYVIGLPFSRNRRILWLCHCLGCGRELNVDHYNLIQGHTRACRSCAAKEWRKPEESFVYQPGMVSEVSARELIRQDESNEKWWLMRCPYGCLEWHRIKSFHSSCRKHSAITRVKWERELGYVDPLPISLTHELVVLSHDSVDNAYVIARCSRGHEEIHRKIRVNSGKAQCQTCLRTIYSPDQRFSRMIKRALWVIWRAQLHGISVYQLWLDDPELFAKYMTTLEWWDNPILQLDRIDNEKGYEPSNLRFLTKIENMRNTRKSLAKRERLRRERGVA